jgi:DNA-binding protein Fis
MNNRSINRVITHDGVSHTTSEWARITGIPRDTLHKRLFKYGWTVERALTTPVG